jgi:hypothetical protein
MVIEATGKAGISIKPDGKAGIGQGLTGASLHGLAGQADCR